MPVVAKRVVSSEYYTSIFKGPQGATGLQGIIGTTGIKGDTGLQGNQGFTGFRGVTGLQGSQGNTGILGTTGLQGSQGNTGVRGTTGLQGNQGNTGLIGQTGNQGMTGLQGSQGGQGVTGLQGLTGPEGISGNTGLQGIQGVTGLAGSGSSSGLISTTSQISISNTTTETTILQTTLISSKQVTGTCLRFRFQGTHQSQATSGTLTFRIYIGSTAGQTIQLASQSTARSQTYCEFEGFATIRSAGANGAYIITGKYLYPTSATALTMAYQGGATTTTVNTTQDNNIKITARWATASTTNILLIQNAFIEQVV